MEIEDFKLERDRLSDEIEKYRNDDYLEQYVDQNIGGSHCYPGIYGTFTEEEGYVVQAEPTSGSIANGIEWYPDEGLPSSEFVAELLNLLSSRFMIDYIPSELFEKYYEELEYV